MKSIKRKSKRNPLLQRQSTTCRRLCSTFAVKDWHLGQAVLGCCSPVGPARFARAAELYVEAPHVPQTRSFVGELRSRPYCLHSDPSISSCAKLSQKYIKISQLVRRLNTKMHSLLALVSLSLDSVNPQTAGSGNLSLLTREFLPNLHWKQRSLIRTENRHLGKTLLPTIRIPSWCWHLICPLWRHYRENSLFTERMCYVLSGTKQAVAEVQRLSIPTIDVACLFHAHVISCRYKLQAMFLLSTSRIFLQALGTRCLFHHFEQTLKVKIIVQAQGTSATANFSLFYPSSKCQTLRSSSFWLPFSWTSPTKLFFLFTSSVMFQSCSWVNMYDYVRLLSSKYLLPKRSRASHNVTQLVTFISFICRKQDPILMCLARTWQISSFSSCEGRPWALKQNQSINIRIAIIIKS